MESKKLEETPKMPIQLFNKRERESSRVKGMADGRAEGKRGKVKTKERTARSIIGLTFPISLCQQPSTFPT